MFGCMHTHTPFCDGKDSIEMMCQAAFEKGLVCLGFSSHAPLPPFLGIKSDWHLPPSRVAAYLDEARSAARRWQGRLAVYVGLEVDGFVDSGGHLLAGPADERIRALGLDFVIGALHYILPARGAPFTVDGPPEETWQGIEMGFGGDARAFAAAYWQAECALIEGGGFDFAAHLDLLKKNTFFQDAAGAWQRRWFREDACAEGMEAAVRALAARGLPAELNTGGLNRGKTPETYPSPRLLKALHGQGVPIIVNADAHRAAELGGNYPLAAQCLQEAGFSEHLLFAGRGNWRREPL
ncbi:MAG: histidinol-phosphatase [Treponema sp.]|jgi:histidinol-phosphatase (PHP family)|nr:histidinol-phosphatase [Treponema sp.]